MTEEQHQKPTQSRKATNEEKQEAAEIIHRLQESGEYTRLQEKLLTEILIQHPEWWDAMRQCVRTLVQSKERGILDITMDELAAHLVEAGQEAIPEDFREAFIGVQIQNSVQALNNTRL